MSNRLLCYFLSALLFLSLAAAALAQDETETPEATAASVESTSEAIGTAEAATQEATGTEEATQAAEINPDIKQIAIGDTVTDSLNDTTALVAYSFEGRAGDIIAISMESEAVDPYLRFLDSQGNPLVTDDDSGTGLNARIGPVRLPIDAVYLVVASTFDAVVSDGAELESGDFTLSIQAFLAEQITIPAQIEGHLTTDTPVVLYSFDAAAGDTLIVSMDSEDFDTLLTVEQTSRLNGYVVTDDDSGPDSNSLIVPYTVPETGTYYIIASGYTEDNVGDFVLNVAPTGSIEIAYGAVENASLSRFSPVLIYSFEGTAGDVIDLAVQAEGDLDTTLTVIGPDGVQVAYNDDLVERNPGIQGLQLAQTGTYKVLVQPFVQGTTGNLTFNLSQSGAS